MDGIHDVGGMDGFGDLPPDEPDDASPFHEDWEGRVEVFFLAGLAADAFTIDEFRARLERQPPEYYLSTPYYERWLTAITDLLADAGVVDREELAQRTAGFAAGERTLREAADGPSAAEIGEGAADSYDTAGAEREPRFAVGDRVRVKKHHPEGHTRCPRYVRGAVGEVRAHRGTHTLPDASARGEAVAEPLYNVRFEAEELWGPGNSDGDAVRIELWESYVEPTAIVGADDSTAGDSAADDATAGDGAGADVGEGTDG